MFIFWSSCFTIIVFIYIKCSHINTTYSSAVWPLWDISWLYWFLIIISNSLRRVREHRHQTKASVLLRLFRKAGVLWVKTTSQSWRPFTNLPQLVIKVHLRPRGSSSLSFFGWDIVLVGSIFPPRLQSSQQVMLLLPDLMGTFHLKSELFMAPLLKARGLFILNWRQRPHIKRY